MELMPDDFIFMDDNAPIHRLHGVSEVLEECEVECIDWWPPFSSDFNPIENLWAFLKEKIRKKIQT
jgi:transposase